MPVSQEYGASQISTYIDKKYVWCMLGIYLIKFQIRIVSCRWIICPTCFKRFFELFLGLFREKREVTPNNSVISDRGRTQKSAPTKPYQMLILCLLSRAIVDLFSALNFLPFFPPWFFFLPKIFHAYQKELDLNEACVPKYKLYELKLRNKFN